MEGIIPTEELGPNKRYVLKRDALKITKRSVDVNNIMIRFSSEYAGKPVTVARHPWSSKYIKIMECKSPSGVIFSWPKDSVKLENTGLRGTVSVRTL